MKLHRDSFRILIEFEKDDWGTGMAKEMINMIKGFPPQHRRYDPKTKQWSVVNDKEYRQKIKEKIEEYSFDYEQWWKEVESKNTGDQLQNNQ